MHIWFTDCRIIWNRKTKHCSQSLWAFPRFNFSIKLLLPIARTRTIKITRVWHAVSNKIMHSLIALSKNITL